MNFAHLHLHTQYSLLDGAIRVKELAEIVKSRGMSSVAITDHGHLLGLVDAYVRLRDSGVKPVLGCETYVCADHRDRQHRRNYHLILLAENKVGYANLMALNTTAQLEGFYYHPRVDHGLLRRHSEGLIALSACLGGECARSLLDGGHAQARDKIAEYQDIFGRDRFFLEVQPNGLPDQDKVNEAWRQLGPELGVGLVGTADCHYPNPEDASAHETLLAIQQNRELSDERRLSHGDRAAYYVRTPAQMDDALGDFPGAMDNAAAIAARCNVELQLGRPMLPRYPMDEAETEESKLADLSGAGIADRFKRARSLGRALDEDLYRARMAEELGMISRMGFSGYFLIVWDFIDFARRSGIPVGPGRGSGAGSIVAWALRITDVDPIEHGLYFERFLNPERVSMPDFDVDFCQRRRPAVVAYVVQKYGRDRVSQIATFTSLQAKSAVDAVAKVRGLSVGEGKAITASIPDLVDGHPATLAWAEKNAPSVREACKDPAKAAIVSEARRLEGLFKTTSVHAAGIVIAPRPLRQIVAVMRNRADDVELDCAQAGMEQIETLGLVKFDFLGLKNLTVIDLAVSEIRRKEPDFDISSIPMDARDVYEMISCGDTEGVFQLIEDGMRGLLRRLRPDRFADLVAVVSLYRPGPLEGGMVDDYVRRKHGLADIESLHPALDQILAETYGVIVYQEQVMQIARAVAGYSLGGADLLRRAMGKKKPEIMAKEKLKFMAGCASTGICDEVTAARLFELMATFAGYGFNKSHATAYALITYQTAFLKRRYPVEYLAALASCDQGEPEKYVPSLRAAGVPILAPAVGRSVLDCCVEGSSVRLGLLSVVGVGEGAARAVIAARQAQGFADLYDFFQRVDLAACDKRALEALAGAGALDELAPELGRARIAASIETLISWGRSEQKASRAGQASLFSLLGDPSPAAAHPTLPPSEEWTPGTKLRRERESLGFYLSGHPTRAPLDLRFILGARPVAEVRSMPSGSRVCILGIATKPEARGKDPSKQILLGDIEDETGKIGIIVFAGRRLVLERAYGVSGAPDDPETRYLLLRGELQADRMREDDVRLSVHEAEPLRMAYTRALQSIKRATALRTIMDANADQRALLADLLALRTICAECPGDLPLVLQLRGAGRSGGDVRAIPADLRVRVSPEMVGQISRLPSMLGIELTP